MIHNGLITDGAIVTAATGGYSAYTVQKVPTAIGIGILVCSGFFSVSYFTLIMK